MLYSREGWNVIGIAERGLTEWFNLIRPHALVLSWSSRPEVIVHGDDATQGSPRMCHYHCIYGRSHHASCTHCLGGCIVLSKEASKMAVPGAVSIPLIIL